VAGARPLKLPLPLTAHLPLTPLAAGWRPSLPQEAERRKREHADAVAAALAAAAAVSAPGVKAEPGADDRERRLKLSGEEAFAARARMSRYGGRQPAVPWLQGHRGQGPGLCWPCQR
jgi:hypothetical protein